MPPKDIDYLNFSTRHFSALVCQGSTRDSQNNVTYCLSFAYLPEVKDNSLAEDTVTLDWDHLGWI